MCISCAKTITIITATIVMLAGIGVIIGGILILAKNM